MTKHQRAEQERRTPVRATRAALKSSANPVSVPTEIERLRELVTKLLVDNTRLGNELNHRRQALRETSNARAMHANLEYARAELGRAKDEVTRLRSANMHLMVMLEVLQKGHR